ncbi:MAG: hypothetical protein CVV49_06465 [Spirochaetae bacterium HGW-Spirochaetae-5]|nr:MAG: hypothetical protein CVV49_06465 [Spirochaetae bacterium HGW-Spirochaetae-5]
MQGHKKSISLIVFFIFIISCKISTNTEKEPNNTFANANKISINNEITGYLESENDTDCFIVDVDQEQILKIALSGIKGVNHAVSIYRNENPGPVLIKVIDDNRKSSPETFANLYVEPGQYFFTISHGSRDIKKGNTETPYKLNITSRSYLNEEKEPDDTIFSATEISDKSIIIGYFSPAQNTMNNDPKTKMQELDFFKFNISITDNIPVLINVRLTGVTGVDSVLSLLTGTMEELHIADNAGSSESEMISDFGIKESGTYYIRVSSKNFLVNHEIPYELTLEYKQYDQNSELESNNSFDKSNLILNNIITGRISNSGDSDFFHFVPQFKNRFYKATCSGASGLDIVMTIYDNNHNKLFEINNSGAGEPEKIPYFMVKNPIYISVTALSLSSPESEYTLALEQYDSNEILEVEPNNSKNTANILNNRITGFITYRNDIDYYLLKFTEKQRVKLTVRGVKNGRIKISTTDPLGFIIKSKEINADEEVSFNEIFDKKGFLIVESAVPDFEFPYTITVEELQ